MSKEDNLSMEYFVLKPGSKDPAHARASRTAMLEYADTIEVTHPSLAGSLRVWVQRLSDKDRETSNG